MRQASILIALLTTAATIWAGMDFNRAGVSQDWAISQKSSSTSNKSTANQINAAQIRKTLDSILAAAKKKDVNAVMKYLAPNATFDMTLQSAAGSQRLQLNRAQYQQYLQQGFELSQTYDSKLSNVKVQILAGGKAAIATYTITETVSMNEPPVTVSSVTDSTLRFERVNGQVLATQMRSLSKVDVKPL